MTKGIMIFLALTYLNTEATAQIHKPHGQKSKLATCIESAQSQSVLIESLVSLYLHIRAMPGGPDKATAFKEFERKYDQVQASFGENITSRFTTELTRAEPQWQSEQGADQNQRQRAQRDKDQLLIFQRSSKFKFDQSPLHPIFYDSTSALVPQDGVLIHFDLEAGKAKRAYDNETFLYSSVVELSRDKQFAFIASDEGESLVRLDLASGTQAKSPEKIPFKPSTIAVSPDGSLLALGGLSAITRSGGNQKGLALFETKTLKRVAYYSTDDNSAVRSIHFSDSGNFLLANPVDHMAQQILVDLRTHRRVNIPSHLPQAQREWLSAQFIPGTDDILFICDASDDGLYRYDIAKSTVTHTGIKMKATGLRISADGRNVFLFQHRQEDSKSLAIFDLASAKDSGFELPGEWRSRSWGESTRLQAESADGSVLLFANDDSDHLLAIQPNSLSATIIKVPDLVPNRWIGRLLPDGNSTIYGDDFNDSEGGLVWLH